MKTISIILSILIIFASFSVVAFAAEDIPVNYCHDDEVSAAWDWMLLIRANISASEIQK